VNPLKERASSVGFLSRPLDFVWSLFSDKIRQSDPKAAPLVRRNGAWIAVCREDKLSGGACHHQDVRGATASTPTVL
jgi:hypothetical protein